MTKFTFLLSLCYYFGKISLVISMCDRALVKLLMPDFSRMSVSKLSDHVLHVAATFIIDLLRLLKLMMSADIKLLCTFRSKSLNLAIILLALKHYVVVNKKEH